MAPGGGYQLTKQDWQQYQDNLKSLAQSTQDLVDLQRDAKQTSRNQSSLSYQFAHSQAPWLLQNTIYGAERGIQQHYEFQGFLAQQGFLGASGESGLYSMRTGRQFSNAGNVGIGLGATMMAIPGGQIPGALLLAAGLASSAYGSSLNAEAMEKMAKGEAEMLASAIRIQTGFGNSIGKFGDLAFGRSPQFGQFSAALGQLYQNPYYQTTGWEAYNAFGNTRTPLTPSGNPISFQLEQQARANYIQQHPGMIGSDVNLIGDKTETITRPRDPEMAKKMLLETMKERAVKALKSDATEEEKERERKFAEWKFRQAEYWYPDEVKKAANKLYGTETVTVNRFGEGQLEELGELFGGEGVGMIKGMAGTYQDPEQYRQDLGKVIEKAREKEKTEQNIQIFGSIRARGYLKFMADRFGNMGTPADLEKAADTARTRIRIGTAMQDHSLTQRGEELRKKSEDLDAQARSETDFTKKAELQARSQRYRQEALGLLAQAEAVRGEGAEQAYSLLEYQRGAELAGVGVNIAITKAGMDYAQMYGGASQTYAAIRAQEGIFRGQIGAEAKFLGLKQGEAENLAANILSGKVDASKAAGELSSRQGIPIEKALESIGKLIEAFNNLRLNADKAARVFYDIEAAIGITKSGMAQTHAQTQVGIGNTGVAGVNIVGGAAREGRIGLQAQMNKIENLWNQITKAGGNPLENPDYIKAIGEMEQMKQNVAFQFANQMQVPPSQQVQQGLIGASTQFNILSMMPGMVGSTRQAAQEMYDTLGTAIQETKDRERAAIANVEMGVKEGTISKEDAANMVQKIRTDSMGQQAQMQVQQAQMFKEMSYGWEARLISQMIGGNEAVAFVSPKMAMRAAVGNGVVNPHFGSASEEDVQGHMAGQRVRPSNLGATNNPADFATTMLSDYPVPDFAGFGEGATSGHLEMKRLHQGGGGRSEGGQGGELRITGTLVLQDGRAEIVGVTSRASSGAGGVSGATAEAMSVVYGGTHPNAG